MTSDTGASPIPGGQRVVLYRKVNRQSAEVIARNLIRTSGLPVFRYYKRNTSGVLTEVPAGSLPMFHSVSKHGAAADTGAVALVDSIAVVKISLVAMYRDTKGGTVIDTVMRDVRIANSGLVQRAQCGETPLVPGTPTLSIVTLSGLPAVKLVWGASTDELAGERDVEMYAVYRRPFGSTEWGEPLTNVPGAGMSTLQYTDNTILPMTQYQYAISALDCTPAPSALTSPVSILVP